MRCCTAFLNGVFRPLATKGVMMSSITGHSRQENPLFTPAAPTDMPGAIVPSANLQATLDALSRRAAHTAIVPKPSWMAPPPPAVAPPAPAIAPQPSWVAPPPPTRTLTPSQVVLNSSEMVPDTLRSLVPPNMDEVQSGARRAPKGPAAALALVAAGCTAALLTAGTAVPAMFIIVAGLACCVTVRMNYNPVLPSEPLSLRLHAFHLLKIVDSRQASSQLVHQLKTMGLLSHGRFRYLIANPTGADLTGLQVNGAPIGTRERNLIASVLCYMRDQQVAVRRSSPARKEELEHSETLTKGRIRELAGTERRLAEMDDYLAKQRVHINIADLEDPVGEAPLFRPALAV